MATSPLTQAHLQAVADALRQHGGSVTDAAMAMGIHRGTFHHQVREAIRKKAISETELAELREATKQAKRLPPERESLHSGRRLPSTADECWALLDDYIGRSVKGNGPNAKLPGRLVKKTQQPDTRRIVVCSDIHAPFHDPWAIAEMILREAKTADTLIIAGDFSDSYSYSRFVRYESITAEAEWAACDALLGHLSHAFREVVMIEGNHDMRLEKLLRAQLSHEVMYAVEQLTGGQMDPVKAIAKRYPNVRFIGHQVGRHGAGWFAQIGDVIVSHAEKFSRVPGAALRSIEEWFRDQHTMLGLAPWRVLLQAHTHQASAVYWASDKLMLETGCLCATHGYQLQPKIGGRPQRRGYITLEQSAAGVTDLNSVRFVWLDPERESAA